MAVAIRANEGLWTRETLSTHLALSTGRGGHGRGFRSLPALTELYQIHRVLHEDGGPIHRHFTGKEEEEKRTTSTPIAIRPTEPWHGTWNGYVNKKCRCADCVDAQRAYRERPEVKEKQRAYFQRPEVKEKQRAYFQRPEVKEKKRAYRERPEVKEKKRAYRERPEVKEKQRGRMRDYAREQRALAKLARRMLAERAAGGGA